MPWMSSGGLLIQEKTAERLCSSWQLAVSTDPLLYNASFCLFLSCSPTKQHLFVLSSDLYQLLLFPLSSPASFLPCPLPFSPCCPHLCSSFTLHRAHHGRGGALLPLVSLFLHPANAHPHTHTFHLNFIVLFNPLH